MRATALQRALPVVAGMIADRTGVEVKTGTCAQTDGKVVYLPPLPLNLGEDDFVSAIGYVYHECGHVVDTDFSVLKQITSALQMGIWNPLEDIRIEKLRMSKSPGARNYLNKLVAILTQRGLDGTPNGFGVVPNDDSVPASFVFQAYLLYKLRHDVLEQTAIKPLLDMAEAAMARFPIGMRTKLEALVFEVERCENSGDVLQLANEIMKMIEEEDKKNDEEQQQDEPQSGDDQSGEPDSDSDGSNSGGSDGAADEAADGAADGVSDDGSNGAPQGASSGQSSEAPDADPAGAPQQGAGAGSGALKELLSMTQDQVMETLDEKLQNSLDSASRKAAKSGRVLTSANVHPMRLPNKQVDTSRIKGAVNSIRVRTLAWLSSIAECDSHLVRSGKSLDYSRLFQGRFGGPMFLRTEEGIDTNTDIVFLEDRSGSMSSLIGMASEAVLASVLAYDIHGVNTQVAVFPVAGRVNGGTDADGVAVIKGWNESPRMLGGRIQALTADGSTPMAEAILWAACDLLKRDPARRIIMVKTDGDPDDVDAAIEAIELARQNGIHVLGLGIGCDVTRVFGKEYSAFIRDISELTGSMVKLIKQAISLR